MVVCKFFLNGNCRYGDNCFNEHTTRNTGNSFSQSGGGQRRPLVQPAKFSSDVTGTGFSFTRALTDPSAGQAAAKSVRFSDDASSNRYFAASSNPFASPVPPAAAFSFTQTLNQMSQPSAFGGTLSHFASATSAFSSQPSAPFGQPLQQQQFPAFSQQPAAPTSPFGQPSLFSQSTSLPAFGQPATFSQPLGGFGQAPAFGASPVSGTFGQVSVFGQQSTFGQHQPQQQPIMQPAFGQNVFGAQPPAPAFGQIVSDPGQSAFGQAAQKPSASDLFSQTTTYGRTGGSFGSSAFGNPIPASSPAETDPTAFSRMDELSEADVTAFRAAAFEFGKVPLLPPPIELCS